MENDTIAAVATPPGTGGVAVIRISGPEARAVLEKVFPSASAAHGQMTYGGIRRGGELLDTAMAVFFYGPRSYTGEDTAELHCHGSVFWNSYTNAARGRHSRANSRGGLL